MIAHHWRRPKIHIKNIKGTKEQMLTLFLFKKEVYKVTKTVFLAPQVMKVINDARVCSGTHCQQGLFLLCRITLFLLAFILNP